MKLINKEDLMDFITGSLVGGLIYDIFKLGISDYVVCVKVALKDLILTEDEKLLISQDLSLTAEEDRSSKENLENFFENKASNTKEIVNKYKTQYNITHNGTGDIKVYNTKGTHIENQVINNIPESTDSKKF